MDLSELERELLVQDVQQEDVAFLDAAMDDMDDVDEPNVFDDLETGARTNLMSRTCMKHWKSRWLKRLTAQQRKN